MPMKEQSKSDLGSMVEAKQLTRSSVALWGYILLFSASGSVVVLVGLASITLFPAFRLGGLLALILASLAAALALHRSGRLRRHWKLAFAYFVASCSIALSGFAGHLVLDILGWAIETAQGFAALKLGEDLAIIGTIIVLTLVTGDGLGELFIAKGRLRFGLVLGVSSFLLLTFLGLASPSIKGLEPERLFGLLPAFGAISLADGLMEELLFRGLFLRKLGRYVGDDWANAVTALVFAIAHLGAPHAESVPGLLVIAFSTGLLFGWIMQKTGSLLAPALLHAGMLMATLGNVLPAYGVAI